MRRFNILVTGVGAIVGYGIVSSIRESKYTCNIIGMDIYEDASGQVWCDQFVKAIPANDKGYISFLKRTMDIYHIDLVFFGTEQEIFKCFLCKNELGTYYEKLIINKEKIIELSEDKWDTMCFLKENGLPYIPSSISANFSEAVEEFGIPLFLKPRRSYASKGILCAKTEEEFNAWKDYYQDQFLVQKYIGDADHEYTAATFGFGDGTCLVPIVMRRKLSKAGATDKAIVERIPEINQEIIAINKILKPIGPTNYQFRKDDKDVFLLMEINPRISASTSIRTAFGYNEAEMCIDFYLEKQKPREPEIRMGRAYRYIADAIIYE